MRIGVQGQYDLYTSFNTREALERVSKAPADIQDKVNEVVDENASITGATGTGETLKIKNGDVGEIAMRLKTSDGFGNIDKADKIGSYDVTKVYSDLEKDESLKQYQYFVGDGEVIDSSEDGIVIQKSGFNLF